MAEPDPHDLSAHLAGNLKAARQRRGLTQSKLAELSGLPRSTLGHLESGEGNPTLSVLATLASALRLSLEELLSPPRGGAQLFRKGSLPIVERGRGGATVQKLLPHPIRGMEIDRMALVAGGRLTGTPHRPGTQEYLCCEQGRLVLHVAGERFELGPGDVVAFSGDQRHSYHNETRKPAVGFSVVTLAPMSPEDD